MGDSMPLRTCFRAYQLFEELDRLARARGNPASIRVDNGPEFAGRLLDQSVYLNKIELDFSQPGKPSDNGFIKSCNGRLRAECFNASWFTSMAMLASASRNRGSIQHGTTTYGPWRPDSKSLR